MIPSSTLAADALASAADRLAELARRRKEVSAFEIRIDRRRDRAVTLTNGKVAGSVSDDRGAIGIHVFVDGGSAYAASTSPQRTDKAALLDRAVRLALANAVLGWKAFPPAHVARRALERAPIRMDPCAAPIDDVLALMHRAEAGARERESSAIVRTSFGARVADTVYLDSAGSQVETTSVLSTLRVGAIRRDGDKVSEGASRRSGSRGLADFEDRGGPEALGAQAAHYAQEAAHAIAAPVGRLRVLCDNHLAGMLAHESFGHLTEYDIVSCGWSTLRGRRGETLGRPEVSVSDSPLVQTQPLDGVRVPVDDQGTPGRKVEILKNGVLSAWMHNRDTAASENEEALGNGRALNARFPAIVRMRNTFFEPGEGTVEEALELLDDGVYLLGSRGGAPYSDGSFMFTALRGYRVRGGKIQEPIRATSIHGNILHFLKNVEMVTEDFDVHSNYFGGCGKADQSFLHVGVGGPHVLVDDAPVGGQA